MPLSRIVANLDCIDEKVIGIRLPLLHAMAFSITHSAVNRSVHDQQNTSLDVRKLPLMIYLLL